MVACMIQLHFYRLPQEMVSKRKRFQAEYGPEGHDDDNKGLKPGNHKTWLVCLLTGLIPIVFDIVLLYFVILWMIVLD